MGLAHTELLTELVHQLPGYVNVAGAIARRACVLASEGGEVGVDFRYCCLWWIFGDDGVGVGGFVGEIVGGGGGGVVWGGSSSGDDGGVVVSGEGHVVDA